jgi:hypothetical protein
LTAPVKKSSDIRTVGKDSTVTAKPAIKQ